MPPMGHLNFLVTPYYQFSIKYKEFKDILEPMSYISFVCIANALNVFVMLETVFLMSR